MNHWLIMSKKIAVLIGTFTSLLVIAPSATAQEYQGCFMVNRSGRVIRLDAMCPTSQAQNIQSTPQEDLRSIAYADAYCTARRDGYPGDVARQRAASAMQDAAIQQAGGTTAYLANPQIPQSVYLQALEDIETLCPEFTLVPVP